MEPVKNRFAGVGGRIAQQRKLLALSQSDFAKRVGVSLSSQKRYENGEREPDTNYLHSLRSLGVDVTFVLTGSTESDEESDRVINGLIGLLRAVGARIGSPPEAVDLAWQEAMENPDVFRRGGVVQQPFVDAIFEGTRLDVDVPLLTTILEGVEFAGSRLERPLVPETKARVVALLYRAFQPSGRIDCAMIDEAVALAAK